MLKSFIKVFAAMALSAVSVCASAQTASEFFDLGVRAYEKGDFAGAAQNFERSASLKPDAAAFHNAGNAHVKLSQPGLARLNYERARYIAPRSPETRANLASILKESGEPSRNKLADTVFGELSNAEWGWILTVSLWGFALLFFAIPMFVKKTRIYRAAGIFSLFVFFVSLSGCVYWSHARNMAVAVSQDALLRISPAKNAPASHSIAEGKSAKIVKHEGDYIFVEYPLKKYGWSNTGSLTPIWPVQ